MSSPRNPLADLPRGGGVHLGTVQGRRPQGRTVPQGLPGARDRAANLRRYLALRTPRDFVSRCHAYRVGGQRQPRHHFAWAAVGVGVGVGTGRACLGVLRRRQGWMHGCSNVWPCVRGGYNGVGAAKVEVGVRLKRGWCCLWLCAAGWFAREQHLKIGTSSAADEFISAVVLCCWCLDGVGTLKRVRFHCRGRCAYLLRCCHRARRRLPSLQ